MDVRIESFQTDNEDIDKFFIIDEVNFFPFSWKS